MSIWGTNINYVFSLEKELFDTVVSLEKELVDIVS